MRRIIGQGESGLAGTSYENPATPHIAARNSSSSAGLLRLSIRETGTRTGADVRRFCRCHNGIHILVYIVLSSEAVV